MLRGIKGLPTRCEYCNSLLVWDSVNLVCPNENCIHKSNEDLKAICLNLAPVDGLGWKTINKCFNDTFYQIHDYNFNNIEDLLNAEKIPGVTGKGERGLFNDMLTIIQCSTIDVSKFLLALNIPGLGKISAKRWEDNKNALDYLEYVANTDMDYNDKWVALEQIIQDKNVVMSLRTKYHDKFNKYFNLLKDRITTYKDIHGNKLSSDSFKGYVCVTGKLETMKRAEFKELLKQHGWALVDHVYSTTKYLITNTPESGTNKNKTADNLGVPKITEADFIKNCL